jgi:hypothetical protein
VGRSQRAFLQQRKLAIIGGPKNPVESVQGPIFQDLVEVEFQPTRISSRLQQADRSRRTNQPALRGCHVFTDEPRRANESWHALTRPSRFECLRIV